MKITSLHHKLSRLFSRNTILVSYSGNSKNIPEKLQQKHPHTHLCNYTDKKQCPLNEQCLIAKVAYQANITG